MKQSWLIYLLYWLIAALSILPSFLYCLLGLTMVLGDISLGNWGMTAFVFGGCYGLVTLIYATIHAINLSMSSLPKWVWLGLIIGSLSFLIMFGINFRASDFFSEVFAHFIFGGGPFIWLLTLLALNLWLKDLPLKKQN